MVGGLGASRKRRGSVTRTCKELWAGLEHLPQQQPSNVLRVGVRVAARVHRARLADRVLDALLCAVLEHNRRRARVRAPHGARAAAARACQKRAQQRRRGRLGVVARRARHERADEACGADLRDGKRANRQKAPPWSSIHRHVCT
eukprot:350491-Chlamydomonas_euryale.AAC.6